MTCKATLQHSRGGRVYAHNCILEHGHEGMHRCAHHDPQCKWVAFIEEQVP